MIAMIIPKLKNIQFIRKIEDGTKDEISYLITLGYCK